MKFKYLLYSRKFAQWMGFGLLLCLVSYGSIAKYSLKPQNVIKVTKQEHANWINAGFVNSKMSLSQSKILKGTDGEIYIKIDLESQVHPTWNAKDRVPTDFVIVLDRSGSMSGKNKMTFAKKAIASLIGQLGAEDRFALVTFDNKVEVPVSLSEISKAAKSEVLSQIKTVSPRGSTNIEAGLRKGMAILKSAQKNKKHAQRLILISDGQANVGVTDTPTLSKIASQAVPGEYVISTIGVGLEFNETLLSSLADYGTGSYHFLEHVAKLDQILADEFYGASQILARGINLELKLAPGIQVLEASGYPLKRKNGRVYVQAGHLYHKQKKSFFVTLKLPTNHLYTKKLGAVNLSYSVENQNYDVALSSSDLVVACLPGAKRSEVVASVDQDTYTKAWTNNHFGRAMKDTGVSVGMGQYVKAKKTLQGFRGKLKEAYKMAPSPEIKAQIAKLDDVEEEMVAAEGGGDARKRISKSYQSQGVLNQRVSK